MTTNNNTNHTSSFDVNEFKRTLKYEATTSPQTIIQDMISLKEFDQEHETKIGIGTGIGVLGIVGIVIGAIALFNGQVPIAVIVGGIGIVLAVVGFSIKGINQDYDVDNRRYEIVSGLLKLLSKDMAGNETVTLSLDCRPHNHKSKLQRAGRVGHWNAKFFHDSWLTMQGRLLDGTRYTISLIEKQQDRHCTKRSASGKTKHKRKTKNASEAIVSLKIKKAPYAQNPNLALNIRKTLKLPQQTHFKTANFENEVLSLRTTTKSPWDVGMAGQLDGVNWIAMMFLSLYQVLHESKS
ncbi:MAG: DUF308 domain-containing protein [Planctomycetaceae bacterium]|nr:DUF308 domain-containing protein [Planctomycetaceae bacterium]